MDTFRGTRPWLEAAIDVTGAAPRPGVEGVDWERLLESAETNRLETHLHALVRDRDDVPAPFATELRERDARAKILGLQAFGWALALIETLEAEGVPTVAYKGPVFSQRLYGTPGHRRMVDLDLIVPRDDVGRAIERLGEDGWRPYGDWDDAALERALEVDCEVSLFHPERPLRVEVHWDLLPPQHRLGLTMEDLWPRLVRREVSGRSLRAFAVEDELLVSCVHAGEKHRWMRLSMTADVARLVANEPELDWDAARANAEAVGRDETLHAGAALAALVAGAPVPAEVLREAAADDRLVARLALYRGRPFRVGRGQPSFDEWRAQLEDLRTRFAARDVACTLEPTRATYATALLRPDWEDRQAMALPRGLRGLWWVVRPLRMFKNHGFGLLRRI